MAITVYRFRDLSVFPQGYVEAMFFTESGEPGDALDGCVFDDLSPEALAQIQVDCTAFVGRAFEMLAEAYYADPEYNLACAGRDFWFTRNGHGVGFRDRGLPEAISQPLDTLARSFGEVQPYKGDDGKIYF